MGPILMLKNILLRAIVTVCRHVLWYAVVHGKDYISRNPEDDLLYCKCDLFEVSMITYDADKSQIIMFFHNTKWWSLA